MPAQEWNKIEGVVEWSSSSPASAAGSKKRARARDEGDIKVWSSSQREGTDNGTADTSTRGESDGEYGECL